MVGFRVWCSHNPLLNMTQRRRLVDERVRRPLRSGAGCQRSVVEGVAAVGFELLVDSARAAGTMTALGWRPPPVLTDRPSSLTSRRDQWSRMPSGCCVN